jgi:hypothetical protein
MDPNEIVPRRRLPSVDHKISDRKISQIYIAPLGHSYSAFWNLDVNIRGALALKPLRYVVKGGAHTLNSSAYTVKWWAHALDSSTHTIKGEPTP